jgi:hypothetical protein
LKNDQRFAEDSENDSDFLLPDHVVRSANRASSGFRIQIGIILHLKLAENE